MMVRRSAVVIAVVWVLGGCSPAEAEAEVVGVERAHEEQVAAKRVVPDDFYDDALSASLDVITAYLRESDLITSESGASPERIRSLVSEAWFPEEQKGFSHYQLSGERTWGETTFDSYVVQLARVTPERTVDVAVYGCVDTTGVFVLPPGTADPPEAVIAWHPVGEDFAGSEEEWEMIQSFYSTEGIRLGDRRAIVFWLVGDTLDSLRIDSSSQWWGAHAC